MESATGFLINIALELGIDKMTAYNTFLEEKKAVVAIIEGDREQVVSFSKLIRERTLKVHKSLS